MFDTSLKGDRSDLLIPPKTHRTTCTNELYPVTTRRFKFRMQRQVESMADLIRFASIQLSFTHSLSIFKMLHYESIDAASMPRQIVRGINSME